ncbi:MAG: sigma-70 family RNA polymerase sigma factor, partial [Tepidisphaeraceae bacterium]
FLTLAVQCKTGAAITYLGPWLKKVAKRTSRDLVLSRKRRTRRESITAENRPEHYTIRPGDKSEAGELHQVIRAELDQLPTKYRMPLVLHYFGGLSHDEISKEMRCTTAALGVRLHRARKMLGKRLTARGISLESAALGAAIAVAIQHVITDRFMQSTQVAAAGLLWGPHPLAAAGSMGASAALPGNLANVLELVGQVGHSMARARMKMATAALAASISVLGGAAEAVRHLPDSIRPSLEFLSPSQIIQNLIQSFDVAPRAEIRPSFNATSLAQAAPPKTLDADITASPTPPTYTYTLPYTPPANQPLLALQVPPTTSALQQQSSTVPGSYHLALDQASYAPHVSTTPALVAPTPLPTSTNTSTPHSAPAFVPSGGSGSSSSASGTNAGELSLRDPAGESSGSLQPISQFSGDSLASIASYNTSSMTPIASFTGSAKGIIAAGTSVGGSVIGPVQVPTDSNTFIPSSVVLKSNDVFVHAGAGTYHWSDPADGILPSSVNSADFTLDGLKTYGVVEIERLPLTTTLAPVRPTGHHFVGIWAFDSDVAYDSIRLTAHYDESLAESLGLKENILKLWVYSGDAWIRIQDSSFSRDMVAHTLSGTFTKGQIDFFAVSAPEPTAIFGGLVLGGAALLRRRRRPSA